MNTAISSTHFRIVQRETINRLPYKATGRRILDALMARMSHGLDCSWASIADIAERAGCCTRTVQRWLNRFENDGILWTGHRRGGVLPDGKGCTTRWRLNWETISSLLNQAGAQLSLAFSPKGDNLPPESAPDQDPLRGSVSRSDARSARKSTKAKTTPWRRMLGVARAVILEHPSEPSVWTSETKGRLQDQRIPYGFSLRTGQSTIHSALSSMVGFLKNEGVLPRSLTF